MKPQFVSGDYVFYNNPGHQWHMMMFQLKSISAGFYANGVFIDQSYHLEYGGRSVWASADQILPKNDPKVKGLVLADPYKALSDAIEMDNRSNDRVVGKSPLLSQPYSNPHEGHEVVENYALGKAFKYCRQCKVEVQ